MNAEPKRNAPALRVFGGQKKVVSNVHFFLPRSSVLESFVPFDLNRQSVR
jgi:hypothetical protein